MKVNIGKYPDNDSPRDIQIHIDDYDVWNMFDTLGLIILPMLKKLRKDKMGAPGGMEGFKYESNNTWPQSSFDFYPEDDKLASDAGFKEWDEILDKMIWSFEQIQTDWEDQYWITHPEIDFEDYPEDEGKETTPLRWKVQGECDWAGRAKHAERIQEGFELLGRFYQNLWD